MKYTNQQHREFIHLSRKHGGDWLDVFDGNAEYYATYYWDLLTELWYANKPVMVSDALKTMKSVKSPFTARKHLQKAIDGGFVIERKNPNDERSMLVELTPQMRAKLDNYLDMALSRLAEQCFKQK